MAIGCHPPCASTGGWWHSFAAVWRFYWQHKLQPLHCRGWGAESFVSAPHAQPTVQLQHENHCSAPLHLGSGPLLGVPAMVLHLVNGAPCMYQPLLEQELSTSHGNERCRIHPHSLSGCSGQGCFTSLMAPAAQTHSWKGLWLCSMSRREHKPGGTVSSCGSGTTSSMAMVTPHHHCGCAWAVTGWAQGAAPVQTPSAHHLLPHWRFVIDWVQPGVKTRKIHTGKVGGQAFDLIWGWRRKGVYLSAFLIICIFFFFFFINKSLNRCLSWLGW